MQKEGREIQPGKKRFFRTINYFILVLAGLVLLSLPFVDYQKMYLGIRLKVLNRLRPQSITYLVNFSRNPVIQKDAQLDKYRFYYKNVHDLMPDRVDALGLYGYCSYYLGKPQKAIEAYQKAIEVNPHFFWFYHNVGLIHFQTRDYDAAITTLSKAISARPENVLRVISLSRRIYWPLITDKEGRVDEARLTQQLRRGYRNSYLVLILSFREKAQYQQMFQASLKAIEAQLDGAGNFHFYAGVALYRLTKYEEAAVFFKKSIEKNPKHVEALKHLGIVSVELGSKELGLQLIKKAAYLKETGDAYILKPQTIPLQPY